MGIGGSRLEWKTSLGLQDCDRRCSPLLTNGEKVGLTVPKEEVPQGTLVPSVFGMSFGRWNAGRRNLNVRKIMFLISDLNLNVQSY